MDNSSLGLRPIRQAIISVTDKSGLTLFAAGLARHDVEIISTGGTARHLREHTTAFVREVSDVTGYPECLDGRLKTLHPTVMGGILAIRNDPEHAEAVRTLGMYPIDLVAVNLYAFEKVSSETGVTLEHAIESIDIGGPTMIRAAAKNYKDVAVIVRPEDYSRVIDEMDNNEGCLSEATRFRLMQLVFLYTANYDAAISAYLYRLTLQSR